MRASSTRRSGSPAPWAGRTTGLGVRAHRMGTPTVHKRIILPCSNSMSRAFQSPLTFRQAQLWYFGKNTQNRIVLWVSGHCRTLEPGPITPPLWPRSVVVGVQGLLSNLGDTLGVRSRQPAPDPSISADPPHLVFQREIKLEPGRLRGIEVEVMIDTEPCALYPRGLPTSGG